MMTAEKALLFGPAAVSGVCAVIFLALYVFKKHMVPVKRALAGIAGITGLICGSMLCLEMTGPAAVTAMMDVSKLPLYISTLAFMLLLFSLSHTGDKGLYFLGWSTLAFCAGMCFFRQHPAVYAAIFMAADYAFSAVSVNESAPEEQGKSRPGWKLFFFISASIFLFLLISSPEGGRARTLGINGFIVFLFMSGIQAAYAAMPSGRVEAGARAIYAAACLIQAAVMVSLFGMYAGHYSPGLMILTFACVAILSAFNALTEEDHGEYTASDFGAITALLALLASAKEIDGWMVAAAFSAASFYAFSGAAFAHDGGRGGHTVAALKYSFEKIKNNFLPLSGSFAALIAEALVFAGLYLWLPSGMFGRTVLMISAAIYLPAFLNRLFFTMSMVSRTGLDRKKRTVLNMAGLKTGLAALFMAAMLFKW